MSPRRDNLVRRSWHLSASLIAALELIAQRSPIPTDASKLLREIVDYDRLREFAKMAGVLKEVDEILGAAD